jgi:hypothetical protein
MTLGSPSYDPVTVALVQNKSSREVFDMEPRDDDWASQMEQLVGGIVVRDVRAEFPEASVDGVECHSSACEITISVPEAEAPRAYDYVQAFVPTGSRVAPSLSREANGGRRTITLVSLMSPELREPGGFTSFYDNLRTARHGTLEKWRAAGAEP